MATVFYLPTRVVFGVGAIQELGKEAKGLGKKAVIVTYPDIRRIGLLDKVAADLKTNGVDSLVFDKVEPNPRSATIDEGAKLARDQKIDLVIGLGGGSAMDAAKGVALASSGTESIWQYIVARLQPKGPVPSVIQVPTMAGTGAEMNYGAVITNWATHEKMVAVHPAAMAKVTIIDPAITLTVPKNQTAAGGVDTFCHIVEAYITDTQPAPLTDGIRETVMKMVVHYLPIVLARLDDIDGRTQLSWASTIAMSQFARLGGGLGNLALHGIEHALSGYYDVTHGVGLAALLPTWMRFMLPTAKERLSLLGQNVFGKTDGIQSTEEWLKQVGMRLRLRDLGCQLEQADEIARLVLSSYPPGSPQLRLLDAAAIAQMYRDAF